MGSSSSKSIDDINASDIAAFVGSLGASFEVYQESIRRSGISGVELAGMKGDRLLIQLETVGVTNRLHKRKLACVCRKEFSRFDSRMDGSGHSVSSYQSYSERSVGSDKGDTRPSAVGSVGSDASVSSLPRQGQGASTALENMCVAQSVEALSLLVKMENQKRLLRQSDQPQGPPTQNAAIVLTDVQGSTSLWEADPQAMREALSLHDEIIRQHRGEHGGYEIDTEGDAFFMAFHSAKDAMSFALGVQAALREAPWGDDILALKDAEEDPITHDRGLRVRVGIHMGPVTTRQNAVTGRLEYTGETMERARQVEGMAAGGEILVTRSTWEASELAAQITDRGNGVVQVLCSQRKSHPTGKVMEQLMRKSSINGASTGVSRRASKSAPKSGGDKHPGTNRRRRAANSKKGSKRNLDAPAGQQELAAF